MEYKRIGTIIEMREVEVEEGRTFVVEKVTADWDAHRGQERWVVKAADELDLNIDHFATEAKAIEAIESGEFDDYLVEDN